VPSRRYSGIKGLPAGSVHRYAVGGLKVISASTNGMKNISPHRLMSRVIIGFGVAIGSSCPTAREVPVLCYGIRTYGGEMYASMLPADR